MGDHFDFTMTNYRVVLKYRENKGEQSCQTR